VKKIALGIIVLLVVAFAALAIFLPGMVSSPAVRARIESAAYDATGREFRFEELSVGLLPPRLRILGPSLAGEAEGDPAFAEAGEVSLQMALWPLLARAVVLESLVVHEATLRLVRDGSGLRLPEPPPAQGAGAPSGGPQEAPPSSDEGAGVSLAVEKISLRNSRILFEDRTVTPAASFDLREIDATAKLSADGPTRFDVTAKLEEGEIELEGTADLSAETADLEARLDGVGLAALAPYLEADRTIAGALSGSVGIRGPFAAPELAADLRVRDGAVRIGDVDLRGPLALRADLAAGAALSGTFDVDASEAALDAFEGTYRKPAGRPANVRGRLVPRAEGGLSVDDVELKIHNLDARGRIESDASGGRLRAELTAEPIDLVGWDELVPALAEYGLRGTLRPGPLKLATAPLSFVGRIGLDGVKLALPEGAEIALRGAIEGTGDAIALSDLVLATGGEELRVSGRVDGLAKDVQGYRVTLAADGAEANTLLSAFTAVDGRLYGPLTLDTDLSGRTGDARLETVSGRMAFAIRPGRLKDVSLLEQTVNRLGMFGEAALLAAGLKEPERMKKMERYYGDEFQELAGTFQVAQGWARTQDLRLVYDGYRVDLKGGLRLFDRRLDFAGTLTMDREVDETLADASGEAAAEPRQRVIELAEVKGTLDDPKVGLSSSTVRGLVGSYAGSKVRRKYQDKLDETLGEGAGDQVGDLVEGLFGGKR
jgi:hypothetical protein